MKIEMKPYQESGRLADWLLVECRERGELLSPLKLQKLMFYADAWNMVLFGKELTKERFQAWVHGPVAVSQFHRFKEFQWRPIDVELSRPHFDDTVVRHLSEIVDVFGSESATALEIMTHQEEPWIVARAGAPDDVPSSNEIDKDITKRYYSSIAEN